MPIPLPSLDVEDTRERLLAAAGYEFSRVGFQAANVRSICDAARANVSAVKYYFGSKEALYLAVWDIAAALMVEAEPMPALEDFDDPRDALRAFMTWFMQFVLIDEDAHPWAGQLLAHETVTPTPGALDVFVSRCAGPITDRMKAIVDAVVGRPLDQRTRDDLVFGVIALCVNPRHSREILVRLGHPPPTGREDIARMAGVLGDFAIRGLDGFAVPAGRGDGGRGRGRKGGAT